MQSGAARRRAWFGTEVVARVPVVAAIAAVAVTAVLVNDQPAQTRQLILMAVLLGGLGVSWVLWRTLGRPALQRRVAVVREQWARSNGWAFHGAPAPIEPVAANLAMPLMRHPVSAIGTVTGEVGTWQVRAQTWLLNSTRMRKGIRTCREAVVIETGTGPYRCTVMAQPSFGVAPAWSNFNKQPAQSPPRTYVDGDYEGVERWGSAVGSLLEAHEDLPLAVSIGHDRIVVLALDDPWERALAARVQLAAKVATVVEAGSQRGSGNRATDPGAPLG